MSPDNIKPSNIIDIFQKDSKGKYGIISLDRLFEKITMDELSQYFNECESEKFKLDYLPNFLEDDLREYIIYNMKYIEPYIMNINRTGEKKLYLKIKLSH